jgi:hypothetical protein
MNLKIERTTFTGRSTIGELSVDGAFECFTLEDMVRPVKVPGMTAIPEGVYVVTVSFSARFQRLLPDVHDVPNFTGVRIHSGNTDADTEGCILVGQTTAPDFVGESRAAFNKLFARIQAAAQREKILLEVMSTRSAARGLRGSPAGALDFAASLPPARLSLVRSSAGSPRLGQQRSKASKRSRGTKR